MRAVPTTTTAIQRHLVASVNFVTVATTLICTDLETVILKPADVSSVCTIPTAPTVKSARLTSMVMPCNRIVKLVSVTYLVQTPGLDLATIVPVNVLAFPTSLDNFVTSVRRIIGKLQAEKVASLASATLLEVSRIGKCVG